MILIETSRLQLRKFIPEDAASLLQLNADPEVLRFTGDKPFESLEHVKDFIKTYTGYKLAGMGRLACIRKSDNKFLGWCGLRKESESAEADLGFRFLKNEWGKGYATESALACLKYGFEEIDLPLIIGRAHVANIASIKVLRKIGMPEIGEFDFDLHPGILFRMTRPDFDLIQTQKFSK